MLNECSAIFLTVKGNISIGGMFLLQDVAYTYTEEREEEGEGE